MMVVNASLFNNFVMTIEIDINKKIEKNTYVHIFYYYY